MSILFKDSRCVVCGDIPTAHDGADLINCYEDCIARLKEAAENVLISEVNPKLGLGHRADVDAAAMRLLEMAITPPTEGEG